MRLEAGPLDLIWGDLGPKFLGKLCEGHLYCKKWLPCAPPFFAYSWKPEGWTWLHPGRHGYHSVFFIRFNSVSESFDSDSTRESQWLLRIDSNQLMTRNGFLEFKSNQVMTQMTFQNFDSNRLTTQKTFQFFTQINLRLKRPSRILIHIHSRLKKLSGILIWNQLMIQLYYYDTAYVPLDMTWHDLFWACPIWFSFVWPFGGFRPKCIPEKLIQINSWLKQYLGELNRFSSWLKWLSRELTQSQLMTHADPKLYWFRSTYDSNGFPEN